MFEVASGVTSIGEGYDHQRGGIEVHEYQRLISENARLKSMMQPVNSEIYEEILS